MNEEQIIAELRAKCDELGLKWNKSYKEKGLRKLLATVEAPSVEESTSEDPIVFSEEPLGAKVVELSNSFVFGVFAENSVKIYKQRGGGFIREYSLEAHGEDWTQLAREFVDGRSAKNMK